MILCIFVELTLKLYLVMKTYILLLRGINVSGQKKVKMADLKKMLEALNFEAIQTYIQSGNVVFKTNENSTDILEKK